MDLMNYSLWSNGLAEQVSVGLQLSKFLQTFYSSVVAIVIKLGRISKTFQVQS